MCLTVSLKSNIRNLFAPSRIKVSDCPFLFAADHAFQIKGQGTIVTGTVLQGKLSVCKTGEIIHW